MVKLQENFTRFFWNKKNKTQDIDRNIVKDDCKLIAQLYNRKIEGYITKDRKSFGQIIKPITEIMGFSIELIDFSLPLKEFKGELF